MDLSFSGSCESDLVKSKKWLCDNLPRRRWGTVYVLGSWYGNMGLIMRLSGIDFRRIVNVDTNPDYCDQNRLIYKLDGFDRPYRIINGDCNRVDLSDADLVINTSTNDITTHRWFKNIPQGATVAIQCRNNQQAAQRKDRPDDFAEFHDLFPLRIKHMSGRLPLKNSDEAYERYMVIGRK